MKKLLKAYGFNSDMQYFERIVLLLMQKDNKASKTMFLDLPKPIRKQFVKSICFEWQTELKTDDKEIFIDLI